MVQFSFYLFLANVFCIVYLMNSGEEYSRNYARLAQTNFALMKIQFFIMALCYIGLCYSVIRSAELLESINLAIKVQLSKAEYWLLAGGYIFIHFLWGSHFIDLSIRAHIYKHSKSGVYNTRVKRVLANLYNFIFSPSYKHKHNGN